MIENSRVDFDKNGKNSRFFRIKMYEEFFTLAVPNKLIYRIA